MNESARSAMTRYLDPFDAVWFPAREIVYPATQWRSVTMPVAVAYQWCVSILQRFAATNYGRPATGRFAPNCGIAAMPDVDPKATFV
jgi:hypothetical protein